MASDADGPRAATDVGGADPAAGPAGEAVLPNAVVDPAPASDPAPPTDAKPKVSWEDQTSDTELNKGASKDDTVNQGTKSKKEVRWQWMHRTGFRDYPKEESDRIEAAYQKGAWMMRMKTGAGKNAKPREIYFVDMFQFDPSTNSTREVRRNPPLKRNAAFSRYVLAVLTAFLNGEDKWWKPRSKEVLDELRYGEELEKLEEQKAAETYRVDTLAYDIISSWWFNTAAMLMILINSIYIWIDADWNEGSTIVDTPVGFTIVDNLFLIWFLAEAIIRLRAFKYWRSAIKDPWFALDILLVVLMICETWILQLVVYLVVGSDSSSHLNKLSILRGLRLLRLARIARLFKVFPQLFVLVKGMVLAMKSLFYTLLLLFVLTFVFAVIFKNLCDTTPALAELNYDSVGGGFWNLLIYGTFLDGVGEMLNALKDVNFFYAGLLIVFIFISNLTMLNMLIGILCEVIARVTSEEEANVDQMDIDRGILEILDCYDMDNDQSLTKEEFQSLMENPDLKIICDKHSIDHQALARLQDLLFLQKRNDDGSITHTELKFHVLMEKVHQLRGGNAATMNDMVELRNWLKRRFNLLEGLNPDTTMRSRINGDQVQPFNKFKQNRENQGTTQEGGFSPAEQAIMAQLEQIRASQLKMEADIERLKEIDPA